MNKMPCQYAIVRFTPFIETGEFANVGIVLFAPRQKVLLFKLVTTRYARVTRFFHELEAGVYRHTIKNLSDELARIQAMLGNTSEAVALNIFTDLIGSSETILRFSEARVVLADSLPKMLDKLFGFYVERDFVNKEYPETALEKTVRDWLREAGMGQYFKSGHIGDDDYKVPFPFVEHQRETASKVIKPLFLGQKDLGKLIDHGGLWLNRIQQLKSRDCLPKHVLFTLNEGESQTRSHQKECQRIRKQLEDAAVKVVLHGDAKPEILRFAA